MDILEEKLKINVEDFLHYPTWELGDQEEHAVNAANLTRALWNLLHTHSVEVSTPSFGGTNENDQRDLRSSAYLADLAAHHSSAAMFLRCFPDSGRDAHAEYVAAKAK